MTREDTKTWGPEDGPAEAFRPRDSADWPTTARSGKEGLDELAARVSAAAPTSIDDMTDVDTTTAPPDVNDVLAWDGADWVPAAPGGGASAIDDLTDVDTATDPPVKNEVLKWNGTNWVPATYDATFTFSIATFTDNEATTQLIGAGVFQADETMTFGATYNNGPPTSAVVKMSINGAAYAQIGTMTAPAHTAGTNTDGDINYPAAKDQTLQFRLDATDGSDPDIEYETAVTFRNYRFWGVISAAQRAAIAEGDVEALSSELSNSTTFSKTINSGAGQYLCVAYPASYTTLEDGADYETDGNVDFLFNSIACAFELLTSALSITNSAGYVENYKVYASTQANLGNYTLSCSTSTAAINPLYYGKTTDTSGYNEADIEGLATSEITNDNTQTWDAVTTGAGEYMLFAFPKRLGTVTFWVGGFEGGFEAPETVSVTNANGWTEDYYVWRSTNANLGATVVATT